MLDSLFRGASARSVVLFSCGVSVRGASPPRVKWTIELRLISAHLRPEESGGKPKVTHLCGQRPVVATHDAVALRKGQIHHSAKNDIPIYTSIVFIYPFTYYLSSESLTWYLNPIIQKR